jgi:hypothetical protein
MKCHETHRISEPDNMVSDNETHKISDNVNPGLINPKRLLKIGRLP